MKRLLFAIPALLVVGCECGNETRSPSAAEPSAGGPRIHASAQPPLAPGQQPPSAKSATNAEIPTDGREVEAGKKLHAEAARGCGDQACLGGKCGKLCVQFMAETYKSSDFRSVHHRNTIYFNCLGACLAEPD